MAKKSTMYQLMRQSELMDDDGMDLCEAQRQDDRSDAEKFKEKYKDFYTDIKINIDWNEISSFFIRSKLLNSSAVTSFPFFSANVTCINCISFRKHYCQTSLQISCPCAKP